VLGIADFLAQEKVERGTQHGNGGQLADLVIVVAKTDPKLGARGTSLIAVETDTPGFKRGRNLEKIGMKAQDTSELFFDNVRVPADNLLGGPGMGFVQLMQQLPQERLVIAIQAIAAIEAALEHTLAYVKERKAFGKPIVMHQAIAFKLANMATEIDASRLLIHRAAWMARNGGFRNGEGSMSKYKASEVAVRVTEDAIQILGGYGYTREYPVERWHRDAKIHTIFEGTSEIQQLVIARAISGLRIE